MYQPPLYDQDTVQPLDCLGVRQLVEEAVGFLPSGHT